MTAESHARDMVELNHHGDDSYSVWIKPPGAKGDAILVRQKGLDAHVGQILHDAAVRTVAALLLEGMRLAREGLLTLPEEAKRESA